MALLLVMVFLLGWPFEWPAIVLIFLPMLAPVAEKLGYDMVWFGTIVAVVLQTAFLSPPVAMSAYYLKQVVKEWNLATIYRGMADFMVIQVIAVALVLFFPGIAMWLPNALEDPPGAAPIETNVDDGSQSVDSLEAGDSMRSSEPEPATGSTK
jgi:TRAP-type mannitol/chloroaromatic compound transport system permease large subunit